MKVLVEAFWDDEAHVWVASSADDIGLHTEADTVEELTARLARIVPDLLDDQPGPFEIELVTRSHQTIAA